jgi:2-phospho-L-lactate guanylyltransferase
MSIFGIVPVKPFIQGKSRLAEVLSDRERIHLNKTLLAHTLVALLEVSHIQGIWVISRDPGVLTMARYYRVKTIHEYGCTHLNSALRQATAFAQLRPSDGVLILPADLPLLKPEDIRKIIAKSVKSPIIVINPDRRGTGTNALLVQPNGMIDYSFGENSFRKHCSQAIARHIPLEIVKLPSIGMDLDLPEDLDDLHGSGAELLKELFH